MPAVKKKPKTATKEKKPRKKKTWNLQAAIFSALRRNFRTYPGYVAAINAVKIEYFITAKNGNQVRRVKFKCPVCEKTVARKEIQVDHVEPVIPLGGIPRRPNDEPDYNVYIERLYCDHENLQAKCKSCHKKKTAEEAKERRIAKKNIANKTKSNNNKTKASRTKRRKVK